MLENIILLAAKQFATQVIKTLKDSNANLNYEVAETLEDLEKYSDEFLLETRLISFLSIFIVPKKILDKLGYAGINLHPGPPTYPGWAPQFFAMYDNIRGYAVTAHFMTEKVDEGEIIGIELVTLNENYKSIEMNTEILHGMERLVNGMLNKLTNDVDIIPLPIPWATKKYTKKLFSQYCEIAEDITSKELAKRIKAFGSGDGISKPCINRKDGKYIIDTATVVEANKKYITLHGVRFKKQ